MVSNDIPPDADIYVYNNKTNAKFLLLSVYSASGIRKVCSHVHVEQTFP